MDAGLVEGCDCTYGIFSPFIKIFDLLTLTIYIHSKDKQDNLYTFCLYSFTQKLTLSDRETQQIYGKK